MLLINTRYASAVSFLYETPQRSTLTRLIQTIQSFVSNNISYGIFLAICYLGVSW